MPELMRRATLSKRSLADIRRLRTSPSVFWVAKVRLS
jgi:hypothetical protein